MQYLTRNHLLNALSQESMKGETGNLPYWPQCNPSQYIFIYDIGLRLSHRRWIHVNSPSAFARGDASFTHVQSHLSKIGIIGISFYNLNPGFLLKEKRDKGKRGWDRGWYQGFDLHLQSCTKYSHFITGISHDFEKCEKLCQVKRYLKRNFLPYCNDIFIQNGYRV